MPSVTGDAQDPARHPTAIPEGCRSPTGLVSHLPALRGHHRYPEMSPVASSSCVQVAWSILCNSSWDTETGEPNEGEKMKRTRDDG